MTTEAIILITVTMIPGPAILIKGPKMVPASTDITDLTNYLISIFSNIEYSSIPTQIFSTISNLNIIVKSSDLASVLSTLSPFISIKSIGDLVTNILNTPEIVSIVINMIGMGPVYFLVMETLNLIITTSLSVILNSMPTELVSEIQTEYFNLDLTSIENISLDNIDSMTQISTYLLNLLDSLKGNNLFVTLIESIFTTLSSFLYVAKNLFSYFFPITFLETLTSTILSANQISIIPHSSANILNLENNNLNTPSSSTSFDSFENTFIIGWLLDSFSKCLIFSGNLLVLNQKDASNKKMIKAPSFVFRFLIDAASLYLDIISWQLFQSFDDSNPQDFSQLTNYKISFLFSSIGLLFRSFADIFYWTGYNVNIINLMEQSRIFDYFGSMSYILLTLTTKISSILNHN